MRIVQLNLAADPALRHPDQLLDTYHTLTSWSEALTGAGATVRVIQRFGCDAALARSRVSYDFVRDGALGTPSPWTVFRRVADAVAASTPDVIHINGLMFPGMTREIRRVAGASCVVVLQDHSGVVPRKAPRPLDAIQKARWRRAFRQADACTFTASELAGRWRAIGLPRDMRVLEIAEASTRFVAMDRLQAVCKTGLRGTPALLWVGRLDANKDPQTVLAALDQVLPRRPQAHLTMIVPANHENHRVALRLQTSPTLRDRVTVLGPVDHAEMPAYYSAADVFLSGSHHEGSGYALIEAMACGAVPCVTDIPAFRALTGGCGVRWRAGDANACAAALLQLTERDLAADRDAVRRRFEEHLTWRVIGQQTFAAYSDLLAARSAR